MSSHHTPVLLNEVISFLNLDSAKVFVDCTLNGGGHTVEVLQKYPNIQIIGIEYDPVIFEKFQSRPESKMVTAVNDSYIHLKSILSSQGAVPDAILFDLGISSHHYESGRGFTFMKDEPLDMRFNPGLTLTAADIVNTYSEEELTHILTLYGEEQFADQIAQEIGRVRDTKPIQTTGELVSLIQSVVPGWYRKKKIHPATKTFQALRIKVNDEMGNVEKGVAAAIESLRPGGKLAVISFHGLEDKIVREIFKAKAKEKVIEWVKRDTIRPTWNEIKSNPRSRSAKMKVVQKLS
jgi:16S rRNA (cytosine1402-N4)-methyltransferase